MQHRDQHVPVHYTSLDLIGDDHDDMDDEDMFTDEDGWLVDEEWEDDVESQERLQQELLELQQEAAAVSARGSGFVSALSNIMGRIVQHNDNVRQRRRQSAHSISQWMAPHAAAASDISPEDLAAINEALEQSTQEAPPAHRAAPQSRSRQRPRRAAVASSSRRSGRATRSSGASSSFAQAAERYAVAAVAAADDPSVLYVGDSDGDDDLAQLRSLQLAVSEDGVDTGRGAAGGRRRRRRRGSMSGPARRVPVPAALDEAAVDSGGESQASTRRSGRGRVARTSTRAARLARLAESVDVEAIVQEYEGGGRSAPASRDTGDVSPGALQAHLQRRALMSSLQEAPAADNPDSQSTSVEELMQRLDSISGQGGSSSSAADAGDVFLADRGSATGAAAGAAGAAAEHAEAGSGDSSDSDLDDIAPLAARVAAAQNAAPRRMPLTQHHNRTAASRASKRPREDDPDTCTHRDGQENTAQTQRQAAHPQDAHLDGESGQRLQGTAGGATPSVRRSARLRAL